MFIAQDQIDSIVKEVANTEDAVVVFHNTLLHSRFSLKNGKECIFMNGEFATSNVDEIKELLAEISAGNPHIYLKKEKFMMDKKELDPMEALRRKIIAEHIASQNAIQAGDADYGNSEQGKLNVASSADVAAAASGSSSGAASTAKIVAGPRG
jgi:hypothetical protein